MFLGAVEAYWKTSVLKASKRDHFPSFVLEEKRGRSRRAMERVQVRVSSKVRVRVRVRVG
jgi:hypothetical protein